ncbi:CinA family protein [Hippea sp. KM1]|uniref:CinA family protein n=1 Tax=Hippea sp. KM1 TaxID=944481 RepID=UPI00046CB88A|nr:CinA family protein [Hippea sp. KM1]
MSRKTTAIVYVGFGADSGLTDEFFYRYGVDIGCRCTIYSPSQLRKVVPMAFEANDGMVFVYRKETWSDLQKLMLAEFERSSVFVEDKVPYVLAKGFKGFGEGLFFDYVYDKPVAFIPYDLKEDVDASVVLGHFASNMSIVRVFKYSGKGDENLVYRDEVEGVFCIKGEDVERYKSLRGCYTTSGQSHEEALFEVLKDRNVKIATAESCTCGLIAAKIANVAGVSAYLEGGAITYSNKLKTNILKVSPNVLYSVGAVSQQTAQGMAIGAINLTNADYSVITTGIAGPSGATKEKPVGLVYIGVGSKKGGVVVEKVVFGGNRRLVREKSARYAILLLRDIILSG